MKRICLYSMLAVCLFAGIGLLQAQQSRVQVEAWEIRHNNRQPPEKIMDAIGLKQGMSIGDIGAGTSQGAVSNAQLYKC